MSVSRFRRNFDAAVILSSLVLAPATAAGQQIERPAAVGEAGAQTSNQAAAASLNQNAEETRQEFYRLLEQHPPGLGRVLRLDPTLLTNEAYLASYPRVAAFRRSIPTSRVTRGITSSDSSRATRITASRVMRERRRCASGRTR